MKLARIRVYLSADKYKTSKRIYEAIDESSRSYFVPSIRLRIDKRYLMVPQAVGGNVLPSENGVISYVVWSPVKSAGRAKVIAIRAIRQRLDDIERQLDDLHYRLMKGYEERNYGS